MSAVADTILAQLGGQRFIAMTGAKNLVSDEHMLQFALSSRITRDGINRVRVILTPDDLYVLEFWSVLNLKMRCVTTREMVPAENLRAAFTSVTGLDCTLGRSS